MQGVVPFNRNHLNVEDNCKGSQNHVLDVDIYLSVIKVHEHSSKMLDEDLSGVNFSETNVFVTSHDPAIQTVEIEINKVFKDIIEEVNNVVFDSIHLKLNEANYFHDRDITKKSVLAGVYIYGQNEVEVNHLRVNGFVMMRIIDEGNVVFKKGDYYLSTRKEDFNYAKQAKKVKCTGLLKNFVNNEAKNLIEKVQTTISI